MSELIVPPHRIECEQSVIGALLLNPNAWDDIADTLDESDFFSMAHRLIFRRIGLMIAKQKAVDVVTLADELDASGGAEQSGGFAYLAELAANTASAANIRHYARVVADARLMRDLLIAAGEISDIAREASDVSAAERIDKAQSLLLAVAERKCEQSSEPSPIASVLGAVVEDVQARYDRDGDVSGLATGFPDIDKLTCGLQPGDLIIIAGRPSMGKTALAVNIAENVALNKKPALVFSLEMSAKQLAERGLASIGGVNLKAMRAGQMTDDDFSRMTCALGKLANAPLIIDERAALSVAQMWARAKRVKRKHGVALIVVDYIQLMRGDGNNRNEEVGSITRGLKMMARDLDVPVIALSQLSRKVEERAEKRPLMSDLRDSGSIEQDADVIAMMYRDEYYHKDSIYKGMAEVIVCKQRMGELGTIHMVFQGEHSRFRSAASEAWSAVRAREAEQAIEKPMCRNRRGMQE